MVGFQQRVFRPTARFATKGKDMFCFILFLFYSGPDKVPTASNFTIFRARGNGHRRLTKADNVLWENDNSFAHPRVRICYTEYATPGQNRRAYVKMKCAQPYAQNSVKFGAVCTVGQIDG